VTSVLHFLIRALNKILDEINNKCFKCTYSWDFKKSVTANCSVWGPHLRPKALRESVLMKLYIPPVVADSLSVARARTYIIKMSK
jgi:hypothetical protein